jgi:hypothetical protein
MSIRPFVLIGLVLLVGCAKQSVVPSVVKVPIVQYVAVPTELTKPCPVTEPTDRTVGEAVRIARARRAALEQCNAQLDGIRSLAK